MGNIGCCDGNRCDLTKPYFHDYYLTDQQVKSFDDRSKCSSEEVATKNNRMTMKPFITIEEDPVEKVEKNSNQRIRLAAEEKQMDQLRTFNYNAMLRESTRSLSQHEYSTKRTRSENLHQKSSTSRDDYQLVTSQNEPEEEEYRMDDVSENSVDSSVEKEN